MTNPFEDSLVGDGLVAICYTDELDIVMSVVDVSRDVGERRILGRSVKKYLKFIDYLGME